MQISGTFGAEIIEQSKSDELDGYKTLELVTIVQNGGPYVLTAVLAFLYLRADSERKELQDRLTETHTQYVERLVNSVNSASQATRDITAAMQGLNTTLQTTMFQIRNLKGSNDQP